MSGMVGNQYSQMANEIMKEMRAGKSVVEEEKEFAPEEKAEKKAAGNSILERVEAEMREESPEGEGGDQWYAERTARIIDAIDPSEFFQLPAKKAFSELGMDLQPDETKIYDAADPETRMEMVDFIIGNNGQGSLTEFESTMTEADKAATSNAPKQMQPKE